MKFKKNIAFLCLLGLTTIPYVSVAQTTYLPNILLLMIDEKTADMIDIVGNKNLHTPVMDTLVQNGLHYTNLCN